MILHRSLLLLSLVVASAAFSDTHRTRRAPSFSSASASSISSTSTQLSAKPRKSWTQRERSTILSRTGEYFTLDRFSGKVEFGSSSNIRTNLDNSSLGSITKWLSNDRAIAMSIWDEKLITEVEPQVYRLKLMTLMFVTIQLAPHVDVRMWTEGTNTDETATTFKLESVAFDPNIQILPGVGVSADSLGILIDVVGELYPSKDGRAVEGKIGFVTKGELPPPMRLLPEQALKGSLSTINRTITKFAMDSFQQGARTKYRQFLQEEQKRG
ncbi:predicted protein [Thalassiosira pseudonana CCMP1335]|uniref:Uncharacterized protein n=1 Tax=Thalassiosira pseudonana TaxID=35128 RepID=B8C0M2_THAPS|nr:predicted protein [Thalassiosira pseudonana CCMP1335]EED93089.1 predicted protein [Thalassiosira pseudonana CCMP1335]|eukprot:g11635.t1 g11635   contig6:269599-270405(-)